MTFYSGVGTSAPTARTTERAVAEFDAMPMATAVAQREAVTNVTQSNVLMRNLLRLNVSQ